MSASITTVGNDASGEVRTVRAALVIAAHGTRDPDGVRACRALAERVRSLLPGRRVAVGFVELAEPSVSAAVREVLEEQRDAGHPPRAVVVPLMLTTGSHVLDDIPQSVAEATVDIPEAQVTYGRPLGADPRLLSALGDRVRVAAEQRGWRLRDVTVVLVGRGAKVPGANAEHVATARLLYERLGVGGVVPAFIQVTHPSVPEGLSQAMACGAKRIVVAPNVLFPGLLEGWIRAQADAWYVSRRGDTGADGGVGHGGNDGDDGDGGDGGDGDGAGEADGAGDAGDPGVAVTVANVIGDCDELAAVVIDRFRGAAPLDEEPAEADTGAPVYLSGLRLAGRDVLVVGAGQVRDRRVPLLLQAGARVRLVSPTISVRLRRLLAGNDRLMWEPRPFADGDVLGTWYVLAATNDPDVNARVATAAEAAHTFCVRADSAVHGSAWTPATATAGGLTVAVVGDRDPHRSVSVRDALLRVLNS